MSQIPSEEVWRLRVVGSHLPWGSRPERPADIGDELCKALLARENVLEDAAYQKITPNQFVVEIGQDNYARNFRLLQDQILQQWSERLLAHLLTANSRQGRQEYRFGGPLKIEIHPVANLGDDQARIFSRVKASGSSGAPGKADTSACLEILPDHRLLKLHNGILTVGRDPSCEIYLDAPLIQQKKLISGQHAYLQCAPQGCRLFDGAPGGKPSLNGTYVNYQRLQPGGVALNNGDTIILAALDANRPDPNTPGVATLRFYQSC